MSTAVCAGLHTVAETEGVQPGVLVLVSEVALASCFLRHEEHHDLALYILVLVVFNCQLNTA